MRLALSFVAIVVAACSTNAQTCAVDDANGCTVRGHCGWFDDVEAKCTALAGNGTRCTCSGAAALVPAFDTAADICIIDLDDDVAARVLTGCATGSTSFSTAFLCSNNGATCGIVTCDPVACATGNEVCDTDPKTSSTPHCVVPTDCAAGRAVLDATRAPDGPVLVVEGGQLPSDGTPWHVFLAPESTLDHIGTLTARWSDGGAPVEEDVTVLLDEGNPLLDVDVALPQPVRPIAIQVVSKNGGSNVVCASFP